MFRGTYVGEKLSRRSAGAALFATLALAVALCSLFAGSRATAATDASGLRVYVVVLDGLKPEEVSPTLTPNLYELRSQGTWYEQARAVFPAETLPNHAAMMTGVLPERNGIVGNQIWLPEYPEVEELRALNPELLGTDTLVTRLENSCDVSTATILSKGYLWSLFSPEPTVFPPPPTPASPVRPPNYTVIEDDFNGDHPGKQRGADFHWTPFHSPGYIRDPDDHTPDPFVMNEGVLPWYHSAPADPQFAFINFGDIDRSGHIDLSGTSVPLGGVSGFRQAALADTDNLLGQFVDELKQDGSWEETVLIIASDHGMDWSLPNDPTHSIDVKQTLIDAGFDSQDYRVVLGGGTAAVYDPPAGGAGPEVFEQMAAGLAAHPGVEFVATRRPGLGYPTLHELGMDHRYNGEIVVFAKQGWAMRDKAIKNPLPGNHGHPATQHSTLMVTGGHPALDDEPETVDGEPVYDPAAKDFSPPAGGPGNLSIAPTVAALFGLGEPEGGYDGQPLTDAFEPWALQPHTPCGAGSSQPALTIDDVSVTEGDVRTSEATFTVSLSETSQSTVTVDYRTADGTAEAPSDYEAVGPATLSFEPGETQRTLTVPIRGDLADEPDETFTVELSNAVNAALTDASATGMIDDDDDPPGPSDGQPPSGTPAPPHAGRPPKSSQQRSAKTCKRTHKRRACASKRKR